MHARSLFLADHAVVHSRKVAAAEALNIPDLTLGASDELLTTAPPGLNSIAWLIWHMARTEDAAINNVLRQAPSVFERDGWARKLGVNVRHNGTGDTPDDLARFNSEVNVEALKAYRNAVGEETRRWVCTLDFNTLDRAYPGGEQGRAAGVIGENAAWMGQLWDGRSGGWFLSWLGVGHNYYHLGEVGVISRALGMPGG